MNILKPLPVYTPDDQTGKVSIGFGSKKVCKPAD